MTQYLLDANHISPLVTKEHSLRTRILQQVADGDDFYVPALGLAEAMYGFLTIPRAQQNKRQWESIRSNFSLLTVDGEHVEEATDLRVALRKEGWQLALVDAVIAATAVQNQLILLTTDRDFSRVPLLKTENWLV